MLKSRIFLIGVLGWSTLTLRAQVQTQITNVITLPATVLENLELTPDQVIIKATAPVGSVLCNTAVINVVCKEDTLVGTGQKEHGVYVGFAFNGQPEDRTVIDFDELDALLSGLDYMSNVTWSVTSLTGFDVNFTTKAGFRVEVFSSRRSGQVEFAVRNSRMEKSMVLTPDQRAQLRALLSLAKTKLVALRTQ